MDPHEKLKVGRNTKEEGNDYFKRGKLPEAQKSYTKVLDMLREEINFTEVDQKKERKSLILAAHLNLAQCALQLGNYVKVIDHCNTALGLDGNNVKAHFRRAKAFENLSEYAKALEGYQTVLRLEPNNSAAQKQQSECQKKFSRERSMEQMSDNTGVIEVEMVHESCEAEFESCYNKCTKNPGHKEFIDVTDFQINHLPPDYRDEDLFAYLKHQIQLTCLVEVRGSSDQRPEYDPDSGDKYPFFGKRYRRTIHTGTGIVESVIFNKENKLCPCTTCQSSGLPEKRWAKIRVRTAKHVVYDETEARKTTCYFFYDTGKQLKSCPRICNAVNLKTNEKFFDKNSLTFISHDQELIDTFKKELDLWILLNWNLNRKYKSESSVEKGTDVVDGWTQSLHRADTISAEVCDVKDRMIAINNDPKTEYQKCLEKQRKTGKVSWLGYILSDKLNGGSKLQTIMEGLEENYKNFESVVLEQKTIWSGITAIQNGLLALTEEMKGKMEKDIMNIDMLTEEIRKLMSYCRVIVDDDDSLSALSPYSYDKIRPLAIIVSHPHGCCKKISIGQVTDNPVHPSVRNHARFIYSTPTCPGSSGAAVFILGHKNVLQQPLHTCGESVELGGRQRNMSTFDAQVGSVSAN